MQAKAKQGPPAHRPAGSAGTTGPVPNAVPAEVASVIDDLRDSGTILTSQPSNGVDPVALPTVGAGAAADDDPFYDPHDYRAGGTGTFTSKIGVVLAVKPYPEELSRRVKRNMLADMPKPPREYIESDDKWVTNNDDSDYRRALAEYIAATGDMDFYVRVTLGTKLLSIPEGKGIIPPDSDEWITIVTNPLLFGASAPAVHPEDAALRYIDWLQYYVFCEGDIRNLYQLLDEACGVVKESAVEAAMKSFRNNR